jgi:hypothetical protein
VAWLFKDRFRFVGSQSSVRSTKSSGPWNRVLLFGIIWGVQLQEMVLQTASQTRLINPLRDFTESWKVISLSLTIRRSAVGTVRPAVEVRPTRRW